jgi:protein-L-isoaspartate(D-aspartate) O-methyltransferase
MKDLSTARRAYAEQLCRITEINDRRIVKAFAKVPRERFLDAGPWLLLGERGYERTPDSDLARLYQDVVVAIDPIKGINNGEPSLHMTLLAALAVQPGEWVLHVGTGTGYYTSILAELAAPQGKVTAVEFDPALAERLKQNLVGYANVTAVCADGTTHDAGIVDAIYVNAGVTGPAPLWLDRLAEGGRLLLMLTARDNWGRALRIMRRRSGLEAKLLGRCGFIHCIGSRDPQVEAALSDAFLRPDHDTVRSLRRDKHARDESCWLHTDRYCLSRKPLPA